MSLASSDFLSHAQRVISLLPDLFWIHSLRDEDLRIAWNFRRQFMAIKPHVNPEEDFQKYRSWVRSADFVWLPRNQTGQLTATAFYKVERRLHQGQPCILIWPEYMYIQAEQRKGVSIAQGFLLALALGILRAPLAPQYVVGTGYVPSYLALCQVSSNVYVCEDPQMTEWERTLYRSLVDATVGYDPKTQVVNMGTIPISPRTTAPSEPQLRNDWQRYVTVNPHWSEGFTCMVFGRIQPSAMRSVILRLMKRLRRR